MTKIVIIGAGPAGRFAAMAASEAGNDVTLIEKSHIGGKCLNQACMVVCAFNDVARHIHDNENFNQLGIFEEKPTVNFKKIVENIKETQKKIRKISTKETISVGVEYVQGIAEVDSEEKVVIVNEDDEYSYDKLLICTGSSPYIPNIKGCENAYTYKDVLKMKEVPENLVIIGGGSTAAEYANIFSSFGSNVEILCRSHFLKMLNDPEAEDYIVSKLLKNTIVHENVEIIEITDRSVITNFGEIEGTVLLATGVQPNSEIVKDIVEVDIKGNILVDQYMQTSNPDIYAAGDVIGGILSTPVARMEATVAIKNIMGENITPDYSYIPMTISLPYDISYMLGTEVSDIGTTTKLAAPAGPGSFWYTLSGKTGYTKETVNFEGKPTDIIAISPSSNIALPYMIKAMKDNKNIEDFQNFLEIHPSTDGISKLTQYFKRYS